MSVHVVLSQSPSKHNFGVSVEQTEPDSSTAMQTSTVRPTQVGAGVGETVGYGVGCGVGIGLCANQTVSRPGTKSSLGENAAAPAGTSDTRPRRHAIERVTSMALCFGRRVASPTTV